jgi:hypothetical protein
MQQFLILISIITLSGHLDAQDYYLMKRDIIFTANYKPPIIIRDKGASSITPSAEDIQAAEKILTGRYNLDLPLDSRFTSFSPINNVQRFFKRYKRQYMGFLNLRDERIIVIHLLNFSRRRRAEKAFEGWTQGYFVGFGEFYEKNVKTYAANLNTHTLALF